MKPFKNSSLLRWMPAAVFLMMVSSQSLMARTTAGDSGTMTIVKEDEKEKKKSGVSAKKSARELRAEKKASPVKLSPDLFNSDVHISAKSGVTDCDFYVFSIDGTLLVHHKLKAGEKKKITGLDKGKYTYQVFSGDTEKASGLLEIRK